MEYFFCPGCSEQRMYYGKQNEPHYEAGFVRHVNIVIRSFVVLRTASMLIIPAKSKNGPGSNSYEKYFTKRNMEATKNEAGRLKPETGKHPAIACFTSQNASQTLTASSPLTQFTESLL